MMFTHLKGMTFVGARRTWVDGVERLHLRFRDPSDNRETTLTVAATAAWKLMFGIAPSKSLRNRRRA